MIEKHKVVALATLGIGEGNPFSMQSAGLALQQAGIENHSLIIKNPLTIAAALRQWRVTNNEKAREKYNNNYEKTRESWPAKILGLASLLQLAAFIHRTKATELVLAQELPIAALGQLEIPIVNAILGRLNQISILGTDVFPKPGAVKIVQQQQKSSNIQIITWNRQAFDQLETQNVNAKLAAPWLIPSSTEAFPKHKNLSPMAVVRPSGTGLNPDYLEALSGFIRSRDPHSLGYQVFQRRNLTRYNRNGEKTTVHKNHFTSLSDLHTKMLAAFPSMLFSYSSEMTQLLAQYYSLGWTGRHYGFSARGLHEETNFEFAKGLGLSQRLILSNGKLFAETEDREQPNLEKLRAELGKVDIASLI